MNFAITAAQYQPLLAKSFLIFFTVFTGLQFIFPHHADVRADIKNWRVNLVLALMNSLIMSMLVAKLFLPNVASVFELYSNGTTGQLDHNLGLQAPGALLDWPVLLRITSTVLALDILSYLLHRLYHVVPFFWRFHAVHHSDENFDTSTAVRFHIGELLLSFFVRLLVVMVLNLPLEGLLVYEMLFQCFNIFTHGNIKLPLAFERLLGVFFITPGLHRKHHSVVKAHYNSNYGTIFSFWDRLGRSYQAGSSQEVFIVGLSPERHKDSLLKLLIWPFRK